LGKKAGSKIKFIQEAVSAFGETEIKHIEQYGHIELTINNEPFRLVKEDVEIFTEDIPGWLVASNEGITVALDINVTDELKHEGNAREFVNKIQNLRKDKGFQVLDRIYVLVQKNEAFEKALAHFRDYISNEILARKIDVVDSLDAAETVEMNDELLKVKVELAN
ncbi:MAG: DUF5915 domain-containing protein, partial [Chitinophagales bacterium]|nr:DUF5915 domain-containing protein [Chitinophagales bacterium]